MQLKKFAFFRKSHSPSLQDFLENTLNSLRFECCISRARRTLRKYLLNLERKNPAKQFRTATNRPTEKSVKILQKQVPQKLNPRGFFHSHNFDPNNQQSREAFLDWHVEIPLLLMLDFDDLRLEIDHKLITNHARSKIFIKTRFEVRIDPSKMH